jgi:CIC family chloride channel protein
MQSNHSVLFSGLKAKLMPRWSLPEDLALMTTALVVGLVTGVGAVVFRYLISAVGWVGYQWFPAALPGLGKGYVLIVPAIGGLLVGLLVYYFAREAKGHGVPEVMEAVALRGGRIRPAVVVVKSLASSLSIGSGGSVGREGPIVQIGSAIGSVIGQKLGLSEDRIRNLVACGAAAGIAATFNAPIAGVLFALEVILGDFGVKYFSSVVVSAVVASVIGRLVFGNYPAFIIPLEYGVRNLWEYGLYALLGVAAAGVGMFYTRLIYWAEDRFDSWQGVIEWVKPAIGGLMLGGLALLYPRVIGLEWERIPQVFNVGYEVIESALANQLTLKFALALLVLKLISTGLTLGSGGSGGVFAPSLFIGSMLGLTFGLTSELLFPELGISPGAYALVGMGAVFAASAHAPLSAILMLFELTGDYRIILPLMLSVVIATILSRIGLKGESIYTLKLSRRGVHLQRGRDVDVLGGVLVSEVMTQDYQQIDSDAPLQSAWDLVDQTGVHSLMVMRGNELFGVLTLSDLERGIQDGLLEDNRVADLATRRNRLVVAFPTESVGQVLGRMGSRDLSRAPVVSPDDPLKLLGMIRREDIIRAYQLGLARRSEIRERTVQIDDSAEDGVSFVHLHLEEGDRAVGLSLHELGGDLPQDCILVSVQRNGHRLIPHGDTVFQAGDLVAAYIHAAEENALRLCLKGNQADLLGAE